MLDQSKNGEQVIVVRFFFYITIVVIANFHKDLYNFCKRFILVGGLNIGYI